MEQAVLYVAGMACGGCAETVKKALIALPGVTRAEVSLAEARAEVDYDPAVLQYPQIKAAVEATGYRVIA
jgi:copper chaperone CopZ